MSGTPQFGEVSQSRYDLYLNRQLSWLAFNRRVLAMALDTAVPLLERLKFLCISSSNLDEFFEIRVARLRSQVRMDAAQIEPDGLTPLEQMRRVSEAAHDFVAEQYRVLHEVLIPELERENIRFVRRTQWTSRQRAWIKDYFHERVLPVLSPLGIDPAHPFPRIANKSLNFVVNLHGKDAFGRNSGIAIVPAPRSLPRLIQLPESIAEGPDDFVFLSAMIHSFVDDLFPGMQVLGCHQFRLTRNSDLDVDEEEVDDLMHALEDELFTRNYGDAVRLEVADTCPIEVSRFLLRQFNLREEDLYPVIGPVNLNRLMMIATDVDRADLKYPSFVPGFPRPDVKQGDIFESIRSGDILLHHPYQSFLPVAEFVRQAAADPNVLAIKQTLYRTDPESPLPKALEAAARAGKEVTVVIELRARFDEAPNIQIAHRLQDAGAHVVYGVLGRKTHAKMCLIVRREGESLKRYAHLGTGNYHPRTARLYTDFGVLTCNEEVCADLHMLFQQLTGLGSALRLKKLLQAPFTLHKHTLRMIRQEARNAAQGKPARIIAKMNSLTEPRIIRALYQASRAGVQIDLIVRGICCLRPGVPGASENIRVYSILGRFLEHSRVFYFQNDEDPKVYLSSADWMTRNMLHRIEVAFPIESPALRERVMYEALECSTQDNSQAWRLESDGSYTRLSPAEGEKAFVSQRVLLKKLAD